ncbi:hypothetical protein [Hymenobacter cheonanensis]|uniref:hypothetical protein n=1 Tax=Hymenobacter sp. CA2-7 TaxID=3063993 RepID=UPI0027126BE9|nr:hypothetical protein [Hymenobacter sp. CA2-7]MDO7887162.1 hypothetical protein [Hymenobacter sp. CA2-7]
MKLLYVTCLFFSTLRLQAQRVSVKFNANAILVLERVPFSAVGKSLKYYPSKETNERRSVASINGKPFFGSDGEVPRYTLAKAVLLLNGRPYKLRVDRMYNPWFGNSDKDYPNKREFRLLKKGSKYKLRGMFSDGAGGYVAEWQFTGKSFVRTVLTNDETFFF